MTDCFGLFVVVVVVVLVFSLVCVRMDARPTGRSGSGPSQARFGSGLVRLGLGSLRLPVICSHVAAPHDGDTHTHTHERTHARRAARDVTARPPSLPTI